MARKSRLNIPGIPHMKQDLGRKYVRYINHSYRRTGTLWEEQIRLSLCTLSMQVWVKPGF